MATNPYFVSIDIIDSNNEEYKLVNCHGKCNKPCNHFIGENDVFFIMCKAFKRTGKLKQCEEFKVSRCTHRSNCMQLHNLDYNNYEKTIMKITDYVVKNGFNDLIITEDITIKNFNCQLTRGLREYMLKCKILYKDTRYLSAKKKKTYINDLQKGVLVEYSTPKTYKPKNKKRNNISEDESNNIDDSNKKRKIETLLENIPSSIPNETRYLVSHIPLPIYMNTTAIPIISNVPKLEPINLDIFANYTFDKISKTYDEYNKANTKVTETAKTEVQTINDETETTTTTTTQTKTTKKTKTQKTQKTNLACSNSKKNDIDNVSNVGNLGNVADIADIADISNIVINHNANSNSKNSINMNNISNISNISHYGYYYDDNILVDEFIDHVNKVTTETKETKDDNKTENERIFKILLDYAEIDEMPKLIKHYNIMNTYSKIINEITNLEILPLIAKKIISKL